MSILIHSARQIVQVAKNGQKFKIGKEMDDVNVLEAEPNDGLSLAVDETGRILAIGPDSVIESKYRDCHWNTIIDASGKSVLPGFVDAHTHPVWAGDRVHEFAMKLAGASYMDVHKSGGGIHFTVNKTKEATEDELLENFVQRAEQMSKTGTTLAECKSGYGLEWETELKMLRVLERARPRVNIDISSTYCGAHAIPKNKSSEEATNDVIKSIPLIRKMNENGELRVESVDVFCEKGVFSTEESRRILQTAKNNGFLLNFHAEELNYIGGVEMGAELKAEAMSHLEEISGEGIEAMAKNGSVAVLLPTTAFLLRLPLPPARKLIEKCVPVALGTDFNPNAHCLSMPIVMFMACVQMKMSMNEALVASTLNAAHSLRKSDEVGSLEVGKWADVLLVDAPRWEHLIYQLGNHQELLSHVIYHGKIVHKKQ